MAKQSMRASNACASIHLSSAFKRRETASILNLVVQIQSWPGFICLLALADNTNDVLAAGVLGAAEDSGGCDASGHPADDLPDPTN